MNWSLRLGVTWSESCGQGHVGEVTWRQQRLNTYVTIYCWFERFIFNFKILMSPKYYLPPKYVIKNSPRSLTSVPLGTYLSPIHWGSVKRAEPRETRIAPPPTHQARFPFPPSHATKTTTDNDPISTAETIAPTSVVFRLFMDYFMAHPFRVGVEQNFSFTFWSQLGTITKIRSYNVVRWK